MPELEISNSFFPIDVRVIDSAVTYNILNWDISPGFPVTKTFLGFNVYYTETLSNPWEKINDKLIDGYYFIHNIKNFTKFKKAFYMVEAVNDTTAFRSNPIDLINPPDVYTSLIIRNEMFDLMNPQVLPNNPALVWRKKTFGNPCPRCNPNNALGSYQDKCPICLGTGKENGYHYPQLCFIKFTSLFQGSEGNNGITKSQENMNQIRTSKGFGFFKTNDYIMELTSPFRLFTITGMNMSESSNVPVTYLFPVQQEESSHPLYTMNIPRISIPNIILWDDCVEDYARLQYNLTEAIEKLRADLSESSK